MLALAVSFLSTTAGRAVLAFLLLSAVIGGIYMKGRSDGGQSAISTINQQTQAAIDEARDAAHSVNECYRRAGMRWNIARAECEGDQGNSGR